MTKKKAETRPSNPPVAVRFTPEQIKNIEAVANEFQMSKQDIIRLSVAAALKAMHKIGLAGLHEFVSNEIKNERSDSPGNITTIPKKKANIMAAAGSGKKAGVNRDT